MALIQDLQKLGLSDKEAKVYLAALELGSDTVQNIAKKSDVNRATAYVILESLSKKGLSSSFEQDKKTYFTASNPELLESIFELQRQEIEGRQKYFQSILPDLRGHANKNSSKPTIRFYEGKAGIETAHEEFLSDQKVQNDTVRSFFPLDRVKEIFKPEDIKGYNAVRRQLKLFAKTLYNSKNSTIENNQDGHRIKVDSKDFPFSCDISILGDSVRIASLGSKLSAVLIKDKEVANTFKALYDLAWEAAEAREKKK